MIDKKRGDLASPIPQKVRQVSADLKWAGWIGFWLQLVLGVVSAVITLFASSDFLGQDDGARNSVTEFGIFCAVLGLIALGISIYYSFRYTTISTMLQSPDPAQRPNRADTIKVIRAGLVISLIGMLLTIIGTEANVGLVLAKSLNNPTGGTVNIAPGRLIDPNDLFVIQANANTIAAHFFGIVSSLLLLNRITR